MHPPTDTIVAPELGALLQSLEALLKSGSYYPAGHARTVAITDEFLTAAAAVRADARELVFDLHDEMLEVQGRPVPGASRGARDLIGFLEPLAVVRLAMAEDLGGDDLHRFITMLPRLRHQVREEGPGVEAGFEGLPEGIALTQREFVMGVRSELENTWDGLNDRIQTLLSELESRGFDREALGRCRNLSRGFGSRVVTELRRRAAEADVRRDGEAAVGHVDLELAKTEDAAEVEQTLDRLVDLLDHDLLGEDGARTHEVFQNLVQILERSMPDSWRLDTAALRKDGPEVDDHTNMPLDELRSRLEIGEFLDPCAERAAGVCNREQLSIGAGIMASATTPGSARRARALVSRILGEGISPEGRRLLVEIVCGYLRQEPSRRLFDTMTHALRLLREDPEESPLELLLEVAGEVGDELYDRLWYRLVNEMLLNRPGEAQESRARALAALAVPPSDPEKAVAALAELEAAGDGFDPELLRSPPAELRPVLAMIVRHAEDHALRREIVARFVARPTSWIAAGVVPMLDPRRDQRELLATLLEESRAEAESDRLRDLAGTFIVNGLTGLRRERREEPWTARSVLALGRLPVEGAEQLLVRIRRERRWLLLPAWPKACREAADQALARLRDRPEGGAS